MKLPKNSRTDVDTSDPMSKRCLGIGFRGFTLVEILIVISIISFIGTLGLFISMDAYRAYMSRSERDTVVSILEKARSRSMANLYQTSWGVCYAAPNYIIFRGSACIPGALTNETISASPSAGIAGLSAPGIVFTQLSGMTTGATIVITENGRTETITINNEGTILW